MTLLNKILNYEEEIFNKYVAKRQQLIQNLKEKDFKMTKPQLITFIKNLSCVIDPVKNTINLIDDFIDNQDIYQSEISQYQFILFYTILKSYNLYDSLEKSYELSSDSPESSDETSLISISSVDSSDSSSVSSSVSSESSSVSEYSSSSKSASLTFSSEASAS